MLKQVLQEIELAQGPINPAELAQKLDVEQTALDGMIEFWVRKGRLRRDSEKAEMVCAIGTCGGDRACFQGCPFEMSMPRTVSLVVVDDR